MSEWCYTPRTESDESSLVLGALESDDPAMLEYCLSRCGSRHDDEAMAFAIKSLRREIVNWMLGKGATIDSGSIFFADMGLSREEIMAALSSMDVVANVL
jgi:hypothetical protein